MIAIVALCVIARFDGVRGVAITLGVAAAVAVLWWLLDKAIDADTAARFKDVDKLVTRVREESRS